MAPKQPPAKRRRKSDSDESHPPPPPDSQVQVHEKEKGEKKTGENGNEKRDKAPLVVFAHGAGAPSTSDWMVR
jgi:hypothetical protein